MNGMPGNQILKGIFLRRLRILHLVFIYFFAHFDVFSQCR